MKFIAENHKFTGHGMCGLSYYEYNSVTVINTPGKFKQFPMLGFTLAYNIHGGLIGCSNSAPLYAMHDSDLESLRSLILFMLTHLLETSAYDGMNY